jgi:micrococcal nuclease
LARLARLAPPVGPVEADHVGVPVRDRAREVDGDTLEIGGIRGRLQGVAAPEVAHPGRPVPEPGGPEAAAFMTGLVEGRIVVCALTGERTRGREVGVCRLKGQDVGAAVIAAGLARECRRFSRGCYAKLETEAGRRLVLPGYCAPR